MRRYAVLLLGVLALAACGAGSGDDDAAEVSGGDSAPKATLGIITTQIETALGKAAFDEASEGQLLDVGDRVRTDATGFAELTYHDGSWQRIEADATLTILALSADASVNAVRTGHDIGRTWNNVQELDDPDDTYEVRTPVATAAVRGTTFATDCPTENRCTFSVLDGTITITPTDGDPITLDADQALTITDGREPADPEPADPDDPWTTKNQELDAERSEVDAPGRPTSGRSFSSAAACEALTQEEADTLAGEPVEQGRRDDSDSTAAFSTCGWISPQGSQVRVMIWSADDLQECQSFVQTGMTSSPKPFDGVGESAAWYAEERMVAAVEDGVCAVVQQSSGAKDPTRDELADAVRSVLTRIARSGVQELPATPAPPSANGGDNDRTVELGS